MFALIWIILVVILIVYSYRKSQKQKKAYKKKQNTYQQNTAYGSRTVRQKQSAPKDDVLTRAKRNVAQDFDKHPSSSNTAKKKEQLINKYKENPTKNTLESSVIDVRQPQESVSFPSFTEQEISEDLLRTVQELIVKGYEPKLSFERDFVSEGIELLNQYYKI